MNSQSVEAKLLETIWTANNYISKKVDNKLGLHGINYTEFLVMKHLNNQTNKQSRRVDLAENIGLTTSGITRMLAPMEKIGLVKKEKNARDARVSLVKLTSAGERVLAESTLSVNEIAGSLFSEFQPNDKEMIVTEMSKLSRAKI